MEIALQPEKTIYPLLKKVLAGWVSFAVIRLVIYRYFYGSFLWKTFTVVFALDALMMLVDYRLGGCRKPLSLTIASGNRKVKQRRFFHGQMMENILSVHACASVLSDIGKGGKESYIHTVLQAAATTEKPLLPDIQATKKYFWEKSAAADTPDIAALRVKVAAVGGLRDDGFVGERRHTTTRC